MGVEHQPSARFVIGLVRYGRDKEQVPPPSKLELDHPFTGATAVLGSLELLRGRYHHCSTKQPRTKGRARCRREGNKDRRFV